MTTFYTYLQLTPVCRDISDLLKADAAKPPAVLLDCYGDDGLALGFSASRTLFRATNIGFINLDRTRQQVPARPDHGAAQLVQPGPGSFVAAKPQFPLEAERTDPILLAGDEPHRQKPHPQRLTGTLEDRPGGQRCLFAAGPTPQPSPCHHPWLPRLSAMGAGESLRPAQMTDILPAGRVVTKAFVHRLKRARVIKSSDRVSSGVHQTSVPRPSGAAKGIPN